MPAVKKGSKIRFLQVPGFKLCSLAPNSDRQLTQVGRDYDRLDSPIQSRMRFFISGAGYKGEIAEVRADDGNKSAGFDEFYR